MSLSLFLIVLFLLSSCLSDPVYLQVGHQAPSVSSAVTFQINGESIPGYSNIPFGSASFLYDLSPYLGFPNSSVIEAIIVAYDSEGNGLLYVQKVLEPNVFQTFYLTDNQDQTALNWYWDSVVAKWPNSTDSWFNVINLSPSDEEVSIKVDELVLDDDFEYKDSTDYYSAITGDYKFEVWQGEDQLLAELVVFLPAGSLVTVVYNGVPSGNPPLQLFRVIDWDGSSYPYCSLRTVQSVPGETVFVWVGNQTEPNEVEYLEVTKYQQIVATPGDYNIYISTNDTKPQVSTTTLDCSRNEDFSLLVEGLSDSKLPLQGQIVEDQNFAPLYLDSNVRVTILSNSEATESSVVYLDGEMIGVIGYSESTEYVAVYDEIVNLTIVNGDTVFHQSVEGLEEGTAYTLYLMGLDQSLDYPLTLVIATDFTSSSIEPVDYDDDDGDSDDDDDDDGLSGGAIAGIVIGVLIGVALIGGGVFVLIRRRRDYTTVG